MVMARAKVDVDEFMGGLDHPLKAEVQAVREIIQGVSPAITEEIKWNAPTFSYQGYLVTFNLHATDRVHLVFHNGVILPDPTGLLEGDYKDRRMAYLQDMDDVEAKKAALQDVVRSWITLMDQPA